MGKATLKILRYNPYISKESYIENFSIPINGDKINVLFGLQYIYEKDVVYVVLRLMENLN